jgi:hypothetical protein
MDIAQKSFSGETALRETEWHFGSEVNHSQPQNKTEIITTYHQQIPVIGQVERPLSLQSARYPGDIPDVHIR